MVLERSPKEARKRRSAPFFICPRKNSGGYQLLRLCFLPPLPLSHTPLFKTLLKRPLLNCLVLTLQWKSEITIVKRCLITKSPSVYVFHYLSNSLLPLYSGFAQMLQSEYRRFGLSVSLCTG